MMGLSKSTVSRALRGLPNVNVDTAESVRRVANELGYIASSTASSLATGRHFVIGVVVPSISRWFYTTVLEGIDAELRSAGYNLMLFNLGGPSGDRDRVFHRSILRRRVDGLIALCLDFNDEEQEQLLHNEYPTIVVGGPVPGLRWIGIDDHEAGLAATRYLLGLGHRQIAHLGGVDDAGLNTAVPAERRNAFVEALAEAGIVPRPGWMLNGEFTFDGGYRATKALLAQPGSPPTAIFSVSDVMAMGAMVAIRESGLRIPADISIIGLDGHEDGEILGLTTISQNPYDQGVEAARALIAEIGGAAARVSFDTAPFELLVRTSTAPPSR